MDSKITGDVPVIYETPQISGKSVRVSNTAESEPNISSAQGTASANAANSASSVNSSALKGPSAYDDMQKKLSIEAELDSLIKQIMPDLGVKFKIHEGTGAVITSVINNDTKEIVREFPAEKILDIVHSMCKKLGIFMNRKI